MDPLKSGWKTSEAHSALLAMALAFTSGNMELGPAVLAALKLCSPEVQVFVPLGLKVAAMIVPAVVSTIYGKNRLDLKSKAIKEQS